MIPPPEYLYLSVRPTLEFTNNRSKGWVVQNIGFNLHLTTWVFCAEGGLTSLQFIHKTLL